MTDMNQLPDQYPEDFRFADLPYEQQRAITALEQIARNTDPRLPHVPFVMPALQNEGVWGVFCLACSQANQGGPIPCQLDPDDRREGPPADWPPLLYQDFNALAVRHIAEVTRLARNAIMDSVDGTPQYALARSILAVLNGSE